MISCGFAGAAGGRESQGLEMLPVSAQLDSCTARATAAAPTQWPISMR